MELNWIYSYALKKKGSSRVTGGQTMKGGKERIENHIETGNSIYYSPVSTSIHRNLFPVMFAKRKNKYLTTQTNTMERER